MAKTSKTNEIPALKELSEKELSETVGGAVNYPVPTLPNYPVPTLPNYPVPTLPSLPACW